MRGNKKEVEREIVAKLKTEAKRSSQLLSELATRFSSRQIEAALSDLLDLGVIRIDSDRRLNAFKEPAALCRTVVIHK